MIRDLILILYVDSDGVWILWEKWLVILLEFN